MKNTKVLSLFLASVLCITGLQQGSMLPVSAETEAVRANLDDSEQLATSDNSFGAMLAAGINDQQAQIQSGCVIYNAEMLGNAANVRFDTVQDSRIIVGLYEDPGDEEKRAPRLLGTGICDVTAEQKEVFVNIEGLDSVPDYYLIRAYLVSYNGALLSKEYENPMHTRAMVDLLNSDINTYADYETLNLDDDINTNFVVYDKDTTVLRASATENIVTEQDPDAGVYKISNYTGPTKTGSVVAIEGGENRITIFKIGSVSKSGSVTTIQADTSLELSEAFEYIKVETDSSQSTCTYTPPDQSEIPEDITVSGEVVSDATQKRPLYHTTSAENEETLTDYEGGFDKHFRFQIGKGIDSGHLNGEEFHTETDAEAGINIGIELSVQFRHRHYQTSIFKHVDIDLDLETAINTEVAATFSRKIPLGGVVLENSNAIQYHLGPYLYGEITGKVTFSIPSARLSYHSNEGWSHSWSTPDVKLSAEMAIGVGIGIGTTLFNNFDANLDVTIGVQTEMTTSDPHEGCNKCIEGVINFEAKGSANLEVRLTKLNGKTFDVGLETKFDYPIMDYYISDTLGFGLGECPNKNNHPKDNPDQQLSDDGLTDEQRDLFTFREVEGGYAVFGKPVYKTTGYYTYLASRSVDHLDIPSSYNGKPVVEIGYKAFITFFHIKSVHFPESIKKIGGYAFLFNNDIKGIGRANYESDTIDLPDSLEEIGEYAFCGSYIHDLVLPDSVRTIGKAAFSGCPFLETVVLPNGLTTIPKYAFINCDSLKSVSFPASLQYIEEAAFGFGSEFPFQLPDGLIAIGKSAFARNPFKSYDCEPYDIIIPDSVMEIGDEAFRYRKYINRFVMPQNTNCKVGIRPFGYYISKQNQNGIINEAVLPLNWEKIPDYFFEGCKLQKVIFSSKLTEIGERAFALSSFTELELPATVTKIGAGAFAECTKLTKMDIPSKVETIEDSTFRGCTNLKAITISSSVQSIGPDAFSACTSLNEITIPKNVNSMYFSAFSDYKDTEPRIITFYNPDIEFLDDPALIAKDYAPKGSYEPAWDYSLFTICGYEGSTAQAFAENPDHKCKFIALSGEPETPVTTTPVTTQPEEPKDEPLSITFSGLKPNTLYNFYDLLGTQFTAENLLYISQGVSDETGTLTVWYRPAKDDSSANKYVRCYESEPTVTRRGDITLDGRVDVSDAVALMRFATEDRTLVITDQGRINADANHDGKVNIDDATTILKYIARMIDKL